MNSECKGTDCGVYFIKVRGEIVYIGESRYISNRFKSHQDQVDLKPGDRLYLDTDLYRYLRATNRDEITYEIAFELERGLPSWKKDPFRPLNPSEQLDYDRREKERELACLHGNQNPNGIFNKCPIRKNGTSLWKIRRFPSEQVK